MAEQIEKELRAKRYDWIVVQGDTTTAAAAATAGFLNHVPVAHVEAGLRTGEHVFAVAGGIQPPRRGAGLHAALRRRPPPRATNFCRGHSGERSRDRRQHRRGRAYLSAPEGRHGLSADRSGVRRFRPTRSWCWRRCTVARTSAIRSATCCALCGTLGSDGDKVIALPVHLNPQVRGGGSQLSSATRPTCICSRRCSIPTSSTCSAGPGRSSAIRAACRRRHRPSVCKSSSPARPPSALSASRRASARSSARTSTPSSAGVRRLTAGDRPQLLAAKNPFGAGNSSQQIADRLTQTAIEDSIDALKAAAQRDA